MNVEINPVLTAYPRTSTPRGAPVPTHLRRRRRLAALATTAVAAASLQAALASPAEAGQVGVTIGVQGSGRVVVVEGSIEDNGNLTCDWWSNQDQRVTNFCPRIRNDEPFEAWVWLRAQRPDNPAGNWSFAGWTGCDTTRVSGSWTECGVHSGAFTSDERRPVAKFVDSVAPKVTSASAQQLATSDRRFRLSFAVDEAGTTECRIVGHSTFAPCASPVDLTVPVGGQKIEVRGIDASGNVGPARAVDVVGVDTLLIPFTSARSAVADFSFDSVYGAQFFCSLDYQAYQACGTGPAGSARYSDLSDGAHVFRVYSQAGTFVEHVPATYEWRVDTTAPTTPVTPAVEGRSARFTFPAAGTVTQECRLIGPGSPGTWATCVSPVSYRDLGDGAYRFEVRSTDAAGNVEDPPAKHTWTVDGAAPDTTATGPTGFVLADSATVGLGSTEPGATFACTLDGVATPCGPAGFTLTGLSRQTHVVTAAARDGAGNADPTPATSTWTVPLVAGDLGRARGWKPKRSAAAYGGAFLEAKRKGATLTRSVSGARQVALVVGKGRKHGKVKVFAGSRLLGTVRLGASGTSRRQLVTLAPFPEPFTGSLRIVVATKDRPVRIEGLGVATS